MEENRKRKNKNHKKIQKLINNVSTKNSHFGSRELIYHFFDLKDTYDYTKSREIKLLENNASSIIDISIDFHIKTNVETEIITKHFDISNILDLPSFIHTIVRSNPNIRVLRKENPNYRKFIKYIISIIKKVIDLLDIIDNNNISNNNITNKEIFNSSSNKYNKTIKECIILKKKINDIDYSQSDLDHYSVTKIGYMILILKDFVKYINPDLN